MNHWDVAQMASLPMPAFASSRGCLVFANAAAGAIGMHWPADRGRPITDFLRSVDGRSLLLSERSPSSVAQAISAHPDGFAYVELRATRIEVDGASADLVFCWDVTERVRSEQELRYHADHDTLTGLLRRSAFLELAARAVSGASGDNRIALMVADMDDFKSVNDRFGHLVGDEVLAAAGRRLRSAVRSGDLVGRFGGDEFLVLATGLGPSDDVAALVDRMQRSFAAPIRVTTGNHIRLNVSVGVAVQASPVSDAGVPPVERLLALADVDVLARKRVKSEHSRGHSVTERCDPGQ